MNGRPAADAAVVALLVGGRGRAARLDRGRRSGLGELDEHEVGDHHAEQDEEEGERQRGEAEEWASGVNGRTAPIAAQVIGSTIIARLGRLRKNGTRRVRMTKTTSVWVASDSTNQPVRNSLVAGVQDHEHDEERQEVEDRADRPEHAHEAAHEGDVPGRRPGQDLGVDAVAGDRHLADVVEQVVEQDLRRAASAGTTGTATRRRR